MGKWTQETGGTKRVVIDPAIRGYWSRERAWHGDKVTLKIEAPQLKDGTKLKVQIWEDGVPRTDPKGYVVELDKGYAIQKGRCSIDHTIAWDEGTTGKPLVLVTGACNFYFLVIVDDVGAQAKSNLLYVHLHDHVLSG